MRDALVLVVDGIQYEGVFCLIGRDQIRYGQAWIVAWISAYLRVLMDGQCARCAPCFQVNVNCLRAIIDVVVRYEDSILNRGCFLAHYQVSTWQAGYGGNDEAFAVLVLCR